MRQRLVRLGQRLKPKTRAQRIWSTAAGVIAVVVVLVILGEGSLGLLTNMSRSNAMSARAELDKALVNAVTTVNPPVSLLKPIRDQEAKVTASNDGSLGGWQNATQEYNKLRDQAIAITKTTPRQARDAAQNDLTTLQTSVATLVQAKYIEAAGFQKRLDQAQASFNSATTTRDYFTVEGVVQDQIAATAAYKPTRDRLEQLRALVREEQQLTNSVLGTAQQTPLMCAEGLVEQFWYENPDFSAQTSAPAGSQLVETRWLADDTTLFSSAATANDYAALNTRITSHIAQVRANRAALLPAAGNSLLKDFQADIDLVKKDGGNVTTYQRQHDADAQQLASARTQADFDAVVKQIQKHRDGMRLPVIRAQTRADLQTLKDLIAKGQASKTRNPADGKDYPNAYEYADSHTGIGDAEERLGWAKTAEDYRLVDLELRMFIRNLQAMLKNLNDKTPWNQAHQTDTELMNYYGVTPYKVIVVSLREQVARIYENGKLVKSFEVTTGRPDLSTPPGMHCALNKLEDTIFISPDPPGSPNYYKPTPVNYAMGFSYYGYFLHDAWWRTTFGKYSNLPHDDPAAFNGGSHGCINMSTPNMKWVYDWAGLNTPLLVY